MRHHSIAQPSEVRIAVQQRADRPVRVEFGGLSRLSMMIRDPPVDFNGDAAQDQGPRFQVIEPSSFRPSVYPAGEGAIVQVWVRVRSMGLRNYLSNFAGDVRALGNRAYGLEGGAFDVAARYTGVHLVLCTRWSRSGEGFIPAMQ